MDKILITQEAYAETLGLLTKFIADSEKAQIANGKRFSYDDLKNKLSTLANTDGISSDAKNIITEIANDKTKFPGIIVDGLRSARVNFEDENVFKRELQEHFDKYFSTAKPKEIEIISTRETTDFNNKTFNGNVHVKDGLEFTQGRFRLPGDLENAAIKYAEDIIAYAYKNNIDLKNTEYAAAAELDLDTRTLTKYELASFILAASMANNTKLNDRAETVKVEFDNKFDIPEELLKHVGADGQPVNKGIMNQIIEIGREILGDNNFINTLSTRTPENDKGLYNRIAKGFSKE